MKKTAFVFLFIVFAFLLASCSKENAEPQKKDYAVVNGETVTADEMDYFRGRNRAVIINEYAEKYGVTDFSDFWDKDFDGSTPSQILEDRAFEQAVEAKIKLVMMRDKEIYDDISFSGLKERAEKYNEEHKNAVGNVGIKTVDMNGFYTYYISTGEMKLKNSLAENELKPTEDELAAAESGHGGLTENGLISLVVSEKYEKLIEEKINNAEIERSK